MTSTLAIVKPTWQVDVWDVYFYQMFDVLSCRAGVGVGVGEIVSNVHLSQLPIIEPDIRSNCW